jgi:leucyl-tRNA synthetase
MNSKTKNIISFPSAKATGDKKYNPSEIESKWPHFAKASRGKQNVYKPSEIEQKWQDVWGKEKIYSPNLDTAKKPFYNLMMFPYPSAEGMHVGNMYAFTGADVYGRFQRMQGKSVFEPIGLDGFGIHSENYAIKVGTHPVEQAKISEKNYYKQLRAIGNGFDWAKTVETYKPEYYKWTQWLFIQLFKAGLAYRKKAPVNFCPSCKTVLADEQVEDGQCERCNSTVEKRDLEQWFFKITKYADRLLDGLSQIDWAEKVKIAQKQWIGKSEGMLINFGGIDVFTTRPETIDGATFLVLSPQHPFVGSLLKSKIKNQKSKVTEIEDYVVASSKKTNQDRQKEKTGVFIGEYVINPVTGKKIPIWIADYVLMGYGTGAIMAVPAEDERDKEFAQKYKLPIEKTSSSAKPKGKKEINYHLRDWLISRQRYWGPPIPLVFCENCARRTDDKGLMIKDEFNKGEMENPGWITVPEKDLPVELPFIKDYKPMGTGVAPLANHPEFYETTCPKCGGEAKRETDVSDTFLDSSWYFLKYVSTDMDNIAFDGERIKKWLPVNMYIGGAEHSVLHLLYSRFITMALHDLGKISFEEPFVKFRAHGLIVKDGAKMSKSKGNVVVPDEYIRKFGADTLRTYLMFMGPFSQGGDFRDTGIEGMHRFLRRFWTLAQKSISNFQFPISNSNESRRMMHNAIRRVTEDIFNLSYNTAIAALMEWYNFLSQQKSVSKEEVETFLKLIAPFAPHLSEELYQLLSDSAGPVKSNPSRQGSHSFHAVGSPSSFATRRFASIHLEKWPEFDPKYLVKSEVTIVVQVNGKLRGNMVVDLETAKDKIRIENLARADSNVAKHLESKEIKKVIYIQGKVLNFVV